MRRENEGQVGVKGGGELAGRELARHGCRETALDDCSHLAMLVIRRAGV
jgi:hypothetical protein